MCMIAHRFLGQKGRGANIPNVVIDTALVRHPDGFGIAWRDPDNGLSYDKFGPDERREFRARLKEIDTDKSIEYVAHFRWATHGPEDAEHAHPYRYDDPDPKVGPVLVFHNGVISGVTTTKEESDTEVFVRDYLAKLPSRWWTNAGIRKLVDHMGGWSKLVLMTEAETVNLNHYAGEEDGGLWYSSEHRPYKGTTYSSWDDDDYENWRYNNGVATGGSLVPYQTSYTPSKSADIGETTHPRANNNTWMHQGHELSTLQKFDFTKDGDYECSVVCDTCGTAGDVYIIDGKAYIDIPHNWDRDEDGATPDPDKAATIDAAIAAVEADRDPDLLPGGPLVAVTPALVW